MSRAQLNQLLRPTMLKRYISSNRWVNAFQFMQRNNQNRQIVEIRYHWSDATDIFDSTLDSISVACILPRDDSHIEVMATIETPDPVVLDENFEDLDNWLLTHMQTNPQTWDHVQPIRNTTYELPVMRPIIRADIGGRGQTVEEYF